jgi:putative tryptophan/tyrosine transport system substrate-binding protein
MRRRQFIGLVGGAAVAWPLVARAQQGTSRRPLIGCLDPGEVKGKRLTAFQDGLKELGYIEGETMISLSDLPPVIWINCPASRRS